MNLNMNAIFLSFLFYATTTDVPSKNTIGYPHGACDAMRNAVNIFKEITTPSVPNYKSFQES